eukprot:CAMPEP_0170336512 /NCGR_PEP_ID=MMETSP0116_2-20130129/69299_1 /TAXON_ID=400756 /ORGANISM="Durinskia baltica, Strain CSIRO CS-38" /LENGTH=70 /DNA_ID=CAMNT_0010589901 /DNA_START=325 /DNA_END=534 /DNA_ORIENTATION=+
MPKKPSCTFLSQIEAPSLFNINSMYTPAKPPMNAAAKSPLKENLPVTGSIGNWSSPDSSRGHCTSATPTT